MTAKDEAKQLDSVTDRVAEQEALDASKAKNAMAALTTSGGDGNGLDSKSLAKIKVSKDDVDIIVYELEVTEDVAMKTIREVVSEGLVAEGKSPLGEALRRLIVQ